MKKEKWKVSWLILILIYFSTLCIMTATTFANQMDSTKDADYGSELNV